MFKNILGSSSMLCAILFCGGCSGSVNYPYPIFTEPICLVERDPNEMYFAKQNLQPFKADKILMIPLYRDYSNGDVTDAYAIAHPFLCQQCDDVEPRLASFGQREKLANIVFWVPGYFPGAMRGAFRYVLPVNGRKMTVFEAQPCIGSEESRLSAEMKALLNGGTFTIGPLLDWKNRPPYNNKPTLVSEPYDFARLVRCQGYQGRYFQYGTTLGFDLWGFTPGSTVVNRFSPKEKKTVAEFAARAMEEAEQHVSSDEKPNPQR